MSFTMDHNKTAGDVRESIRYIRALEHAIGFGDHPNSRELLSLVLKHNVTEIFDLKEDETILHVAIKMRTSCHVIAALIDTHPLLLSANRANSTLYRGQTALHIALTLGDHSVIEIMLRRAKEMVNSDILTKMLEQKATGTRFVNTVMHGELPLSVTALTLNTKLFDVLLSYGARVDGQNSGGDNVCHSLIKYAHLYPEKIADIMKMLESIAKKTVSDKSSLPCVTELDETCLNTSYIWMARNNEGFNPLQLSAELGQHAIFKFIMELRHVYCHVNSEDGLFDVELYDVTDIDLSRDHKLISSASLRDNDTSKVFPYKESTSKSNLQQKVPTLEMMFKNDPTIVFKFIQLSPLRYVTNRKWAFYRWFYAVWGILHMLFMVGYTVYAIRRSKNKEHEPGSDVMVTVYMSISVAFAIVYLGQEVIRIIKGHMPWSLEHVMNCYHNGPFRLMLVMFSITVLADVIWKLADEKYRNYFLICSVILGWWFIVFFLRGIRQFSFFTVMIQKVLVGDMFRFSIIIGMELIAFTTGMLIAFREMNPPDETVQEFSKLLVHMFKMMFGFTSLDVLFDARQPWLTVCLYVGFVLLTYVLMVNSLIAMMSNTCSVVSQNRQLQYRLQQMSIILFFESLFPPSWIKEVGEPRLCSWFDPNTNSYISRKRLFMEVRSLREVTKSRSRHRMTSESMLESIFNTLKNIQTPPMIYEGKAETVEAAVAEDPVRTDREVLHSRTVGDNANGEVRANKHKKKKKSKKKKHEDIDKPNDTAIREVLVATAHTGATSVDRSEGCVSES